MTIVVTNQHPLADYSMLDHIEAQRAPTVRIRNNVIIITMTIMILCGVWFDRTLITLLPAAATTLPLVTVVYDMAVASTRVVHRITIRCG